VRLTKRKIDDAECHPDKTTYLWDKSVSGFGVKLLSSGTKKYIYKYRPYGGGRRVTPKWKLIGTHGAIPLETARKIAIGYAGQIANGEDPQAEKMRMRDSSTLAEAWQRFLLGDLQQRKHATIRDYRSIWNNYLGPRLGNKRIIDLSRADVDKLRNAMSDTPALANQAIAVLSKLMTLAEVWEWRPQGTHPCRYVKRNSENKRTRYMSTEEVKRLEETLSQMVDEGLIWPDIANLFRLLLLTGARRGEISTCQWSWVDFHRKIIELPDSKTGAKPIYLSEVALDVLRAQRITSRDVHSAYVFPGRRNGKCIVNLSKPWAAICTCANLEDLRIHDLRHTAASVAVGQGIDLPVIGKLLGHTQTQTTARYAHVDTDPALQAANLIGDIIGSAL
jgi:integrase